MVGAVVPSRNLMELYEALSDSIRISFERKTYPAGKDRDWAMRLSSNRWSSERMTQSPRHIGLDVPMASNVYSATVH